MEVEVKPKREMKVTVWPKPLEEVEFRHLGFA